jgi:hypothetical protein
VSYVYAAVDSLVTTPPKANVGTGQCVALIEAYTNVPRPAAVFWKQGAAVRGNVKLQKGTAIATFIDGKYPSHPFGNHAALYDGQDAGGIFVVEQFVRRNGTKTGIERRYLPFRGKDSAGNYIHISDNGDAYAVIE